MRTPIPLAVAFLTGLVTTTALGLPAWAVSSLALGALGAGSWAAANLSLSPRAPSTPGTDRVRHRFGRRAGRSALLLAGAFAAGLALDTREPAPKVLSGRGGAELVVHVELVRHGTHGAGRSRVRVIEGRFIESARVVEPDTRLWVTPHALPEGATLRLRAELSPQVRYRNLTPHPPWPDAYPTAGYATLEGPDAFELVAHPPLARVMNALRADVRARLRETLDAQAAAVAAALTLGDPDTLMDDDDDAVRAAGMTHVFAVSGMHITLMAGVLVALLRRALLRVYWIAARYECDRIACAVGVPLSLFIAELTGGSPSGYRAAVTSAIAFGLSACGLRPHAGAVASFACLVFAAVEPREAIRPAFLLSIAATAAILSAAHAPETSAASVARTAWTLSVRTSLATAPILLWSFGAFAWVSAFANVLLVPIGSLLLVLAAVHALLAAVVPWLAPLTALPVELLSAAFLRACEAVASIALPWASPPMSIAQGVCFALACGLGLLVSSGRARVLLAGAAGVMLALLELALRHQEQPTGVLRVTFVDVGQGDAALIDLPDGRAMLIDAGGSLHGGRDPGERALVPLLQARRRTHLDVVVLTHPHPDHYGGLMAVASSVSIGELWDTGQSQQESSLHGARDVDTLIAKLRARGTRVLRPDVLCDTERRFGDAAVSVLWPCPSFDAGFDENDNSLVLRIQHGERRFLFTGDIEQLAERALLDLRVDLRADVLKVAHHGSRTSSTSAFVRAVAPVASVISAGMYNSFGHPHPETLATLRGEGGSLVDLGSSGGAVVTSDGARLRLRTWARPEERLLPLPGSSAPPRIDAWDGPHGLRYEK